MQAYQSHLSDIFHFHLKVAVCSSAPYFKPLKQVDTCYSQILIHLHNNTLFVEHCGRNVVSLGMASISALGLLGRIRCTFGRRVLAISSRFYMVQRGRFSWMLWYALQHDTFFAN